MNGEKENVIEMWFLVFFWKSKLCPGDPSICIHSYTVEELHTFYNYYNYLLDISELCAEGYQLDNNDRSFF